MTRMKIMVCIVLLTAVLPAAAVEFPMESTGVLEAYSFFKQSVEHFIYSNIGADIRILQAGDFSWQVGMSMETYMGENWNSPEMKFNIYGGHWNIRTQFAYMLDPLLARAYIDHDCFHNIDMPDTLSEYMNNIKFGVVLDRPPPSRSEEVVFLPSGAPDGWFSIGLYRPRGDTFQKGHDFNWSMHGYLNFEGVAYRSWFSGLRYSGDLYFHDNGSGTSRHRGEVFIAYQASKGIFEAHLTHYISDTQPFRSLDGQNYWGIRFIW